MRISDERFRALVQNSSDMILVMDPEGIISYISPSVERVLGYVPEAMMGTNGFAYVHPGDAARVQRFFAEFLSQPGTSQPIELRLQHRDGSWRHIEGRGGAAGQ